jgi:uncharacterized protein
MILEGIITTLNPDGDVNISPMGPQVDAEMRSLVLKPYRTSTTYQNLKRHGEGVFHVTDDVLLLAQAAVGRPDPPPQLIPAKSIKGMILTDACRWYAFRVRSLDDQQERTEIVVDIVDSGRQRDFLGFNRGKNAVLEAAILATRTHLLPPEQIFAQFESLRVLVGKTGGEQEHAAFQFLADYVRRTLNELRNEETLTP